MTVISRKEAKARGLTTYFTGKPCVNGHTSKRFVANYTCWECLQETTRTFNRSKAGRLSQIKSNNKPENKIKKKLYKQVPRNKKRARELQVAMYAKSPKLRAYMKNYNASEKGLVSHNVYRKSDSGLRANRSQLAKRRAAKLNRTPCWSCVEKVKEIYSKVPDGYVVDHIIPLQGKLVSGLHVHNNLQYLTKSENCSKSNKFIID